MRRLEELLSNSDIEDIVLSKRGIAYFSKGEWHGPETSLGPKDLDVLARNLAERSGITLGPTQPSADSHIKSPSGGPEFRAHVIVPPLALDGPEITLRRLSNREVRNLKVFGLSAAEETELTQKILGGASLLIVGPTGAGKSTLLLACLSLLPIRTRAVILEDSSELPLLGPLWTKLMARSDRFGFREGAAWTLQDLVHESLRMRPDRIIVGECRGSEASAIASALLTGHRGVMTTMHADSVERAHSRFEELVLRARAKNQEGDHGVVNSKELWDGVMVVECERGTGQRRIKEVSWKS